MEGLVKKRTYILPSSQGTSGENYRQRGKSEDTWAPPGVVIPDSVSSSHATPVRGDVFRVAARKRRPLGARLIFKVHFAEKSIKQSQFTKLISLFNIFFLLTICKFTAISTE